MAVTNDLGYKCEDTNELKSINIKYPITWNNIKKSIKNFKNNLANRHIIVNYRRNIFNVSSMTFSKIKLNIISCRKQ